MVKGTSIIDRDNQASCSFCIKIVGLPWQACCRHPPEGGQITLSCEGRLPHCVYYWRGSSTTLCVLLERKFIIKWISHIDITDDTSPFLTCPICFILASSAANVSLSDHSRRTWISGQGDPCRASQLLSQNMRRPPWVVKIISHVQFSTVNLRQNFNAFNHISFRGYALYQQKNNP